MMEWLRRGLYYLVLWLVALFFFAPVFWIALSSFKTAPQILAVPPIIVFRPTLANYARLFAQPAFQHHFINSILLSVTAVLLAVRSPLWPPLHSPASSPPRRTS